MLLNHPKKCTNQITRAAEDKKIIVTKYHQKNHKKDEKLLFF